MKREAVCAGLLGCLAALAGCRSTAPEPIVISADRTVQAMRCAQHPGVQQCYEVTDVWMQERYQLERALRLTIERLQREQEPHR